MIERSGFRYSVTFQTDVILPFRARGWVGCCMTMTMTMHPLLDFPPIPAYNGDSSMPAPVADPGGPLANTSQIVEAAE